jgi:hypothetical protein
LLLATPAQAQRGGCGLGLGLQGLDSAEHRLATPAASLLEARDLASAVAAELYAAARQLAGCGCRRLAEQAEEAARTAEQAASESSVIALRRSLDRARFSVELARQRAGRDGCS